MGSTVISYAFQISAINDRMDVERVFNGSCRQSRAGSGISSVETARHISVEMRNAHGQFPGDGERLDVIDTFMVTHIEDSCHRENYAFQITDRGYCAFTSNST